MAVMPQGVNTISGGTHQPGSGLGTPIPNAGAPSVGTSAVQTITASGTVSGGTYRIGYSGSYTTAIPFGAANLAVDSAIEVMLGAGATVTIGGGPLPGAPITVTFGGNLAGANINLLTVDSSGLTGGGSYVVANTTQGVNASGRGAATGGLLKNLTTGDVYRNSGTPPAVIWGAPLALEAEQADEEEIQEEEESDEQSSEPEGSEEEKPARSRRKSVKGPPEDKGLNKETAEPKDEEPSDER